MVGSDNLILFGTTVIPPTNQTVDPTTVHVHVNVHVNVRYFVNYITSPKRGFTTLLKIEPKL